MANIHIDIVIILSVLCFSLSFIIVVYALVTIKEIREEYNLYTKSLVRKVKNFLK